MGLIPDGWLYTGDVAVADEDGFLHIRDRIKNVVRSGGGSIFPSRSRTHCTAIRPSPTARGSALRLTDRHEVTQTR
jgi:acyl-CoA synthetase (AMP-forming)/AMP-acid ligase II